MTINRRNFLTISGSAILGSVIAYYSINKYRQSSLNLPFEIEVIDHPKTSHLMRQKNFHQNIPIQSTLKTKTLIIGSGIAGLSAAENLNDRDFIICDSLNRIGGSAASYTLDSFHFPTGAHYIPEYPTSFDNDVLTFLKKKKIIDKVAKNGKYEFTNKQYYIDNQKMQLAQYNKQYYTESEVPFHPDDEQALYQIFDQFFGEMQLPSRNIQKKHHHLSKISFKEFLDGYSLNVKSQTRDLINYRMRDDYGHTYDKVCAIAGLTHYAGRPLIDNMSYSTFSAPQGNGFFARKIAHDINNDQYKLGHTVINITDTAKDNYYETLLINSENRILKVVSENIIYAANKHTLKYVYPKYEDLYKNSVYSPWVVIGFLVSMSNSDLHWQNEIVDAEDELMGFAIEKAENEKGFSDHLTTISVYYNFPPESRSDLLQIIDNPNYMINKTIEHIEQHIQKNIKNKIQKCFLKAHGHGMAICQPNFLFNDRNDTIQNKTFAFAGCDNGRLPLFFEAVDSGLVAARIINQEARSL